MDRKLKQIHLIHHTHYDIGFTDLPDEVERQQLTYLDEAVRLAENDPEYCWTIESASLLRNYLESRPQTMVNRLLNLLRKGQLEVAAFDMQMLSETASFPELLENVMRSVRLGKQYDFPVECAILDDIGGFAGELPRLMNEAGLRYLIAGCGAFQTELPWADLPHLFYLESKGGGKILVWNLGNDRKENSCESKYAFPVYGMGSHYLGYRAFPELFGVPDLGVRTTLPDDTEEHRLSAAEVFQILEKRLEQDQYPYPELLLQYGGDNRNPSPKMAELVRKLNASGDYPLIKLCTPSAFFHEMEEKYGNEIPVIKGVLTDPWNIRINAVPAVLKKYRGAQRFYDALRFYGMTDEIIQEHLMLVADHTLGLNIWGWQDLYQENGNRLTAACFDRPRESWACNAYYAEDAYRRSKRLSRNMTKNRPQEETEGVIVRNRTPHKVSGAVELYLGSYARRLISLKDASGNEVPRQLCGQNRWMIYVQNVPALGSLRLIPEFSDIYDEKPVQPEGKVPAEISSKYFDFTFAEDGTLKKVQRKDGTVLLDGAIGEITGETVADTGVGGEDCGLKPCKEYIPEVCTGVTCKYLSDGNLYTEILQSFRFACGNAERIVRIWKELPRIDFSLRLDLPESPAKKCWYGAFPFAGTDGTFRFDQNVGIVSPEELLPGSMLDLFYCSRFASVETEDYTAVLCCPDAPIVEFGGKHTAKWRKELPLTFENNHIYGLLFNNICNTDAPAWQSVLESFSYSLFFHASGFDGAAAQTDWNSITALESELSFESADPGVAAIPDSFRVHTDYEGKYYLENLLVEAQDYSVNLQGKDFSGNIKPCGLEKI